MKRFKYLTLAALVGLWACDSGTSTPTEQAVTGTISGTVTIEGTGASGVTVTLSSGTTATTDASGTYAFANVSAGAYTVTISGFATDATFDATAKAATITTAGQVASVSFAGSYIKTSAIVGVVTAAGQALSGVTVSIGSAASPQTTGSAGEYSFSGLRAGSYTVTISGYDATMYNFTTSQTKSVAVGASEVVSFTGTLVTTASISGRLYLDENNKDNTYTAGLEDNLSVANVAITLEGNGVSAIPQQTTMTAADGTYSFPNLAAGNYRLTIDGTSAALPGNVAFGGTSTSVVQPVSSGGTASVNWPFDITVQRVDAFGYLGIDGTKPGITPITGWTVNLYDTESNAVAGGATGKLNTGTVKTDATGRATFRFTRTKDISPNGGPSDQIVFAQIGGAPGANYAVNGETVVEIKYNPKDSIVTSPDTFDALYSAAVIGLKAQEIDDDVLAGWQGVLRANKDTTGATTMSGATGANGWVFFDLTPAALAATSDGALPDTLYMRLSTTQAGANGHGFTQAPSATEGTVIGGQLKFIWDGTVSPNDTIWLGADKVTYTDADVLFGVHHEKDDSTGVTPTFTKGDATTSVGPGSVVQLYSVNTTTGAKATAGAAVAPGSAGAPWKAWERPMFNLPTVGKTWEVRARTTDTNLDVLNDTAITFTIDGSDQVDTVAPLSGSGGVSTFALKANNAGVTGTILSVDGVTPVAKMRVMIQAAAGNIQPNKMGTDSTVVKTTAGGAYSMTGMREGPYDISVQDSTGVWAYFTTLKTSTAPVSGTEKQGNPVNNTDAHTAARDVEGYAANSVVNFAAHRMDTKVQGVVAYDRDADYNTLDPDEALSGVTVELYSDTDGDGVIDAGEPMVGTTTTDGTGAYGFSALKEGKYNVKAISPANATVLRALSATGSVTNTVAVTTAAATGAGATLHQNGTNQVGNMSPPAQNDELPRWNYLTGTAALDGGNLGAGAGPNFTNAALTIAPAHFVHLFNTGTVSGKIIIGAGTGVAGVRVTITRCQTTATAPSPPAGGACTAKHGTPSPWVVNVDTDANGNYAATGLLEGVYQVDVAPATAGYTNNLGPDGVAATGDEQMLATLQGNNDIETVANYIIS